MTDKMTDNWARLEELLEEVEAEELTADAFRDLIWDFIIEARDEVYRERST